MQDKLKTFLPYIYKSNGGKMLAAHVLDLITVAGNVVLPSLLFSSFSNTEVFSATQKLCFAIFVSNTLLPRIRDSILGSVRHDVQKKITLDMVKSVYDRELDTYLGAPTGSCAVLTSKNYGSVGLVIPTFYSEILPPITETIGISTVLYKQFGGIGLLPLLTLGGYLLAAVLGEKRTTALKEENSSYMRIGFYHLLASINNYQVAHQYGNTDYELAKLDKELSKVEKSYNDVQTVGEKNALILSVISRLALLGSALYFVAKNGGKPDFFLSKSFMLFATYLLRFSSIIEPLPAKLNTFYTGYLDIQLIADFFNSKSIVRDPIVPKNFQLTAPPTIEFKDVTFGYKPNEPIVSNVSFTIKAGQKIAIMGETGCGKSTLLKLIQRFYNPEKGQILINDIDITEVLKKDLRDSISVVTQDTALMETSLSDNIKYGDLDADDDDILNAARFADLNLQENRFSTIVQQGGANFSGGEKQRINIARAILKPNSFIFLLDEPTSALDSKTADEVLSVLDQLTTVATTIIVTHDPKVVVNADLILYLEKGKIIERGSFAELMHSKGKFYNQVLIECKKLGMSVEEIKPIPRGRDQSEKIKPFLDWRYKRNHNHFFKSAENNKTKEQHSGKDSDSQYIPKQKYN